MFHINWKIFPVYFMALVSFTYFLKFKEMCLGNIFYS